MCASTHSSTRSTSLCALCVRVGPGRGPRRYLPPLCRSLPGGARSGLSECRTGRVRVPLLAVVCSSCRGRIVRSVVSVVCLTLPRAVSKADTAAEWSANKLGEWVTPTEIVNGGTKHLHGVMEGGMRATIRDAGRTMSVSALDAAVVNFGQLTAYPSPVNVTGDTATFGSSFLLFGACARADVRTHMQSCGCWSCLLLMWLLLSLN
jgi:hypothetical protein